MRNYEERNQSGKPKSGRKQKRHWRIIALLLCVCVTVTAYPELPSMLAVFAAEKTDEGGQETKQEQETAQDGQEPAEATQHSDGKTEDTAADEKKDATEETAENRLETAAQDGTQEEHVPQESTTAQTVSQEDVSAKPESEPAQEPERETLSEPENGEPEPASKPENGTEQESGSGSEQEPEGESEPASESESAATQEPESGSEPTSENTTEELTETEEPTETDNTDNPLQALSDRIAKLPDLEEYLADEPDVDDEGQYEAWQETLYETAQEALAIWEEYEALPQEQQEQLAKEVLEKLKAWTKLAKQLTEGSMTMAAADGEHQDHTGWTALKLTSNGNSITLSNSGNYYISNSIDKTYQKITVKSGATVNLCLNGQQYNFSTSGYRSDVIEVEDGATLNLHNCVGNGKISNRDGIVVQTSGTLNVYGGALIGAHLSGSGSYDGAGIYATGANAAVNLYSGCTVKGINSAGVYLDSDTRLLVDGATIRNEESEGKTGTRIAALYIGEGANVEIKSGGISGVDIDKQSSNATIRVLKNATVTISGGEFEGKFITMSNLPGDATAMSTSGVVINGGIFRCSVGSTNCDLTVNGGKFLAGIGISTALKMSGDQAIRSETLEYDIDIIRGSDRNVTGIIELTGALTNTDPYRIQLPRDLKPASERPIIITKGFSAYMQGKTPEDYFESVDNYKMILKDGEVAFVPWVMTFDANGGEVETKKGDINGALQLRSLPIPTRAGYDFDGWYTQADGGDEITIDNMPLEDITVYAHWTLIPYTIAYDLAGGALPSGKTNPTQYTVETPTITLNNPTKTGYDFTGWSGTDLTGAANKTVKITKGSLEDRAYTANWSVKSYTVTLNKNGGTGGTALTQYTYGTGAMLPTDWKKTGYTFAGWYDNTSLTGTAVTKIAADATENKTFYAKWTANSYKVTFDYQGATGNNTTKETNVTYNATYGTLPAPTKTGYTFQGWYTQTGGKGSEILAATTVKITAAQTLYAHWLDQTPPDAPKLQSGVTLPADWTNTQKTIPLTLYDGVGVTELWVKTDSGAFQKINSFSGGTTYVCNDVLDGTHTYQFQAKDAAGNVSVPSDVFTIKLDTTKPVIGTLTYGNHKATLWQWIIGKTDLIINVPITENGSGADEISYTVTPQGGQAQTKTAPLTNGKAEITFDKAFQGTVTITCTDKVGNVSDSVTAGTNKNAAGVLVEDTAPTITANVSEGYYEVPTSLTVTVSDDTENAISAGVATVTYQVDNGAEQNVTVDSTALQEKVTFQIPASEIPTGVSQITIRATDNAGNTATEEFTVKVKGPEHTPQTDIDYGTTGGRGAGRSTVKRVRLMPHLPDIPWNMLFPMACSACGDCDGSSDNHCEKEKRTEKELERTAQRVGKIFPTRLRFSISGKISKSR